MIVLSLFIDKFYMFYTWTRMIISFIQTMLLAILKLIKITAVILILLSATNKAKFLKNCALHSSGDTSVHLKHGDVMLAGIFQLTHGKKITNHNYPLAPPEDRACQNHAVRYLRHFLAFDFAIEEINKNPDILPNITLGYDVYDTCYATEQAMQATMRALSGGVKNHWNYRCSDNGKIVAFIGHLMPTSSLAISLILSLYGYTQISYGETFNNNLNFPFFYHTAHGTNVVNKAIIRLLKYFGWTWIGIITADEDELIKSTENLKEEIVKSGLCVEYIYTLPKDISTVDYRPIKRSRSRVIVLNISLRSCPGILHILILEHLTIILTKDVLAGECNTHEKNLAKMKGTLFFVSQKGNIIGLKEVIHNASPVVYPNNTVLQSLWLSYFECVPPDNKFSSKKWCKKNFTLSSLPVMEYYVENFRTTYSVYLAVYAVAHALNNMYMANSKHNGSFIQRIHPKQLNRFIRNIHFQTPSGDDIVFDEKGISNKSLELLHFDIFPNRTFKKTSVGEYNPNVNENHQFFIKKDYNKWAERVRVEHLSFCHDICFPGYRKIENPMRPCCYSCVPCSAKTFSNGTDMEECEQCPEDEWPNSGNTACVKRPVDFLSFHDLLGSLLTSLIVILFVFSIIILIIFIIFRETPIVKANNRNLSYTILISLMLCFLCSLLFIGNPDKMTCLLQNIIFNLIFAVAVSSILVKTITVLIAFNVTKAKRRFSILLLKIPHVFVISCLIGEFSICACWIRFYPPYPDRDSVSKPGILILHCNVGSHVIFYLALGYNSFLALLCFLVAYFAKKLPDRFNEARHITFSMLVFCSVWISFIPVYISTIGKYMTAVQVFAILASSSGLLGFIFFPKCFIILFRPELNVKKSPYIAN